MDAPHLKPDVVRRIGLDAVRSVAGRSASDIAVDLGLDSANELAWFIAIQFDQDPDRRVATEMRARIGHRIRDALIAEGDEHYPFLRFLTRSEWNGHPLARSA